MSAAPQVHPHAATFRDEAGEVVGYTPSDTTCLYPRKPSALAAVSEDGRRAVALPCGFCPGCKEFYRRRLADRLVAEFGKETQPIWLVEFNCPLGRQSSLFRSVHRTTTSRGRLGFLRCGTTGVAMIVVGPKPRLRARSFASGYFSSCGRMARPSRRHAWSKATRGLLRSRDEYGAQTNRWYIRGLAPAEKERWSIDTRVGIRGRAAGAGARIRATADGISLFAPESWRLPRLLRRKGPERKRISETLSLSVLLQASIDLVRAGRASCKYNSTQPVADRPRSSSPMPGIVSAKPSSFPNSSLLRSKRERYRSSLPPVSDDLLAWAARMAEKSRARKRGSG